LCIYEGSCKSELKDLRKEFIRDLIRSFSRNNVNANLELAREIVGERIEGLLRMGFNVFIVDAVLEVPGVFGCSHGVLRNVFEVGLFWDHIVDLPFIPGSSFKGGVRGSLEALLIGKGKSGWEDDVKILFGEGGDRGWAGSLLFLDAYPVGLSEGTKYLLEPDILTPHYQKDTETIGFEYEVEPVPISHISIAPGTIFRFVVAYSLNDDLEEALVNIGSYIELGNRVAHSIVMLSILRNAFENYGLGARTSRGYGRFSIQRLSVEMGGRRFNTPVEIRSKNARRSRGLRKTKKGV